MKNFPFIYNDKEYWYSRSIVCTNYIFCKYKKQWYVLACKRGPKSTGRGLWNVPGGFLDHDETCVQCATRETREETSLFIPNALGITKLYKISDGIRGHSSKQHIVFSYYTNLGEVDDFYKVNTKQSEPGEVTLVEWISVKDVYKYEWINNQSINIMKIYKEKIDISWKQRFKNYIESILDRL